MKLRSLTRARLVAFGAFAGLLAGCLPGTDVNVTLRVIDTDGKPIRDALVLTGAWLTVQPPLDPPFNKPLAANRGMTDAEGVLAIDKVRGFYVGEKPQDAFYKALESWEPKVDRKVTGIVGGSILILAPGYGLAEQPFGVEDNATFQEKRKFYGDADVHLSMSWFGVSALAWTRPLLLLRQGDFKTGKTVTVTLAKPKDPEEAFVAFNVNTLINTKPVTTGKVGATVEEKRAIYDFFEGQLRYAVNQSSNPYFAEQLAALERPKLREWYENQEKRDGDEDTTLHAWLAEKSLELLPAGYEEPKRYVAALQRGVAGEGISPRQENHFYNPNDQGNSMPGGQTALKWGAIDYPDNPDNGWDWQDSLRYYRAGDKERAYEALGHVLHLLADMGAPERTHIMKAQAGQTDFQGYLSGLLKKNNGSLPWEYSVNAKRPVPVKSLKDHFDGLAKLTFGPMKDGGQILDFDEYYRAAHGDVGVSLKSPNEGVLASMGEYLLPRTIEFGAGLLERFQDETHPKAFVEVPGDEGENDLRESHEVSGLRLHPERVSVTGHSERTLPASATPQDRERRVPTENPRLLAYQQYDAKGVCRIRLLSNSGAPLSEFRCNSGTIFIPKNKDIVWIMGKTGSEGLFEHGRSHPLAGVHFFDANGRQLAEVPTSETGTITRVEMMENGELFFIGWRDKEFHLYKLSADGRVLNKIRLANGGDLRILNDGAYFAIDWNHPTKREKISTLFDPAGKTLAEFSDEWEVAPEIVAITKDGKHLLVAKNLEKQGDRQLEVYRLSDTKTPVKSIPIDFYPSELLVRDDLQFFVARHYSGPGGPFGLHEGHTFQVLDVNGKILSHYDCMAARSDAHISWASDQDQVDWLCGDRHIELGIK